MMMMTSAAGMLVWSRCCRTQTLISFIGILSTWCFILATDVKPQLENYVPDYAFYHNLSGMAAHLRKLASRHSDIIHIDWGYHSRNGVPQLLTRITNFSLPSANSAESVYFLDASNPREVPKVRILFSYGEHAREFFPVESFFYLLKNLTDGLTSVMGSDEERYSRMILSHFDIYAIVMANPDGRKLVEASHNFCWRGTSTGVDINRNFDWQFARKGSSGDPKDEEFRGAHPFSEPECSVYVELTQRVQFDAFLSFHAGVRHIYIPFADTASKTLKRVPANFQRMWELSSRLAVATKYKFRYGKAYDLNFYTADGTAFDYMAGVQKIPFSLAVEMWENVRHKGFSCFDEFNPHSEHLQMEVEAFHPMYVELFSYLRQWKLQQFQSLSAMPAALDAPSMTLNYVLLAVVLLISAVMAYRKRQHICATKRRIVHLRRLSSTFTMGGIFR